jgi:hypothetical protein
MNAIKTVLEKVITGRFLTMTGAKKLMEGLDTLSFDIPKSNGINKVKITYVAATDTFDIKFYNFQPAKCVLAVKAEVTDVYIGEIANVFSQKTKLLTSL